MDVLEPGCSFAQIMEKINELVSWVNAFETDGISYTVLSDKPKIDNVELSSETGMKDLRIDLAQFPNISQLEELVSNVAGNMATEIAGTVAASVVQNELGVSNAKTTGIQPQDNWKILVYAQNDNLEEIRYSLTIDELAEYVNTYLRTVKTVIGE